MRPRASTHALRAIEAGRHVVMVNVEADALVGPLLARRAQAAGVVYTLAYGDQPALICELVEWARLCGFEVVCAGKGTKHLPAYHEVTPATVWEHYGLPPEQTAGLNAQMFCSFLDGTKSAVEMAAVANATGLVPQARGLGFPACGTARPGGAAATGARGRRARPQRHARGRLEPARGRLARCRRPALGRVRHGRRRRPLRRGRVRRLRRSRPRATAAWPRSGGRRISSGSSSA